jgi:hypothetical protein
MQSGDYCKCNAVVWMSYDMNGLCPFKSLDKPIAITLLISTISLRYEYVKTIHHKSVAV